DDDGGQSSDDDGDDDGNVFSGSERVQLPMSSPNKNLDFECPDCKDETTPKTFESKRKLKDHRQDFHSNKCRVRLPDSKEPMEVPRANGCFACPLCDKKIKVARGLKKHIKRNNCHEKTDDDVESIHLDEETDDEVEPINFDEKNDHEATSERASLQDLNVNDEPIVPSKRSLDELILTACGQLDGSNREKKKTLLFVEGYELSPVSLSTKAGTNYTLLAHESILGELSTDGPVEVTVDPSLLLRNPENTFCS
ncbi:hypothetical protein BGX21_005754, partial [Mortierella sp. AD011]